MASTNRTGRVSAIDYKAGTYEVTYFDRGKSVTRQINAMSNGEYKMPKIGQIVSVSHNSNGTAAATTTGTVWNKTNKPAEGYRGLYRKEFGEVNGQAFERYDANTGVYTQYVNGRTGRNCNGQIYDEAKGNVGIVAGGNITLKAGKVVQIESESMKLTINGVAVNIGEDGNVSITCGTEINMEAPVVNIKGASGEVEIGGIKLTSHKHTGNMGADTSAPKP